MKKEQIEKKVYETVYVAFDGTKFKDETECRKYEETSDSVIKKEMLSIKHTETYNPQDDMPYFSCDSTLYALHINGVDDIRKFNMYSERYGLGKIIDEKSIGKVLIIEDSGYGDWWYDGEAEELKKRMCDTIDAWCKLEEESEG